MERERLERLLEERAAELRAARERLDREIAERKAVEDALQRRLVALTEPLEAADLALRKQAEEALRASEQRLAEIIDFLPDATFVVDQEGKVIVWNRAAEAMTGVSARDVIGKGEGEHAIPFYGHRRPILIDLVRRPDNVAGKDYAIIRWEEGHLVAETGAPLRGTKRFLWATASAIRDRDGKTVGAIESVRDVTQQKETEEELARHREHLEEVVQERTAALRDSEQRLADIINFLPDATFAIDRQGKITLWNRHAEEFTGVKASEMMGKGDHEYAIPFYGVRRPILIDLVLQPREETEKAYPFFRRQGGRVMGEALVRTAGGGEAYAFGIAAPLYDPSGRLVGAIQSIRDISEHKRMEEELLRGQKLESVGLLAGGIAHDFNNVLASVLGYVSLAQAVASPDDQALREYLADAKSATLRARGVSQRLLTFAKGGAPVLRPVSVREMLKGAVDLALTGATALCDLVIADDLWPVEADEGQLGQAIGNVIVNAEQAMAAGGRIEVSARNAVLGKGEPLPLPSGDYIQIEIRDQGVGIGPEHLPRIFDPYFTTKEPGRGLGLTAAYAIVKKHGGHLTVRSTPGAGSSFSIYLPAAHAQGDERRGGGGCDVDPVAPA